MPLADAARSFAAACAAAGGRLGSVALLATLVFA
jgi:hypothetical protein